jgi:CubicO group peptidase (beta-lactamase class C family)
MKSLGFKLTLVSLILALCLYPIRSPAAPSSPAEMNVFMDGLINQGLQKYNIPGAVFLFVKDGRVFFQKGYGYADLEKKQPFDPERTVLRVASNSKLFTATAVMQLVERGKIRLDADVNTYLKDMKIPDTYPRPVTMLNLLTHTAGFDEKNLGMSTLNEKDVIPLGTFLKNNLPVRVMEPGTVASYSNMGLTLAGYIVELVSGEPFHAYAREHIFRPLGMASSDFMPRPDLMERMAVPYLYRGGKHEVMPYDYEFCYPAGSLMTTASDMARFMIAHLQNGGCGEARILKTETARLMHRRQFAHHPALPGMAVCFMESKYRGVRMLEHGGWTAGFKTLTTLIPDRNAGFFISYNIEYAGPGSKHYALANEVKKAIVDHYYAVAVTAPAPVKLDPPLARRLAGSYRTNRHSRGDITKFGVFTADLSVKALPDGSITVRKDRYIPRGGLLFEKEDGSDLVAFREDGRGRITHLFIGSAPHLAYDRLAWHETSALYLAILVFSACIFIAAFITSIVVHVRRNRGGIKAETPVRWAWRIIAAVSFLNVAMLVSMVLLLLNAVQVSFFWELPTGLVTLLAVGVFTSLLSLPLIGLTLFIIKRGIGGVLDRAFAFGVCVAAAGFTWFLHYWNLLGFKLG